MKPPDSDSGFDEDASEAAAAAWVAQRDAGFTPRQAAEFARWLHGDPRHAVAFSQVEQTSGLLGKLRWIPPERLAPAGRPAGTPFRNGRGWTRSPWVRIGVAAAIVLAAGIAGVQWGGWGAGGQVYATTAGGFQRATLDDGSVIELNSRTRVSVRYSANERRLELMGGEAHFTVVKNRVRPFVVHAGRVAVRAVGTAFDVRWSESGGVDVMVTEGRVQVGSQATGERFLPASEPRPPLLVAAGERVAVPAGEPVPTTVERISPPAIRTTLSWQEPMLIFVDTPLAEVVERFNQRNQIHLVLADPTLGSLPVGGSFRPENVEAFVRLLASNHDLSIERRGQDEIVLRRGSR